jgi:hypothetical protein
MENDRRFIRDASAPSLKAKYKFSNTRVYGKATFFGFYYLLFSGQCISFKDVFAPAACLFFAG